MWIALVAWAIGALGVLFSARQLRRFSSSVGAALDEGPDAGGPSGLARFAAHLPKDDELGALLDELLSAPSDSHALAALGELRLEATRDLGPRDSVAVAATRVSLASGTLLALVILSTSLAAGSVATVAATVAFAGGGAGAFASAQIARSLRARGERRAARWKALLAAAARQVSDRPGGREADPLDSG